MLPLLLSKLGFKEKEGTVYQTVLELGRATAGELSKRSGIPRATVYGILGTLQESGLIVVEAARGSTYYLPSPPASLLRILDKERDELAGKENAAKQLVELVSAQAKRERVPYPKIQLAEGREKISNMLYDVFAEWRKAALRDGDNNVWGYQDAAFLEQFKQLLDWRWKTASENIFFFTNLTEAEQKVKGRVPGRQVRTLPGNVEFQSSIYIFGKHHVMLVASREKPSRAVLISEPTIAANLQTVFKLLWQMTDKPGAK